MSNQTLIHNELKLSKDQILAALRIMMLARRTDEKHLMVLKQGKSFFHIGCSGHEAIQVAIGLAMNPEKDWAWTYYRDLALTYTFGHTPNDHFLG
ncbi:MAG: thiamine pyrophosphate-dependent enzyme, partial [Candidatus Kapaibacterium sp.]